MSSYSKLAYRSDAVGEDRVSADLEHARSRIEKRFLDGGAILLSVLDAVSKLISTLDDMTGSLDDESASRTMTELTQTMEHLARLPALEESRQESLAKIAVIEKELRGDLSAMRETLRYLRTFAVTAKISGAGIPDFAGFAEEIIERIQYGSSQTDTFSERLGELSSQLKPATVKGREILESYRNLVPKIAGDLSVSTGQLSDHHAFLAGAARKVRALTGGVQNKLATILSAMQIGDITRQRIEHCQSSFEILGDYLDSPAGLALREDQRARLQRIISKLVFLQLGQAKDDFDRDTAKIVTTVTSFKADIREILSLRQAMTEDDSEEGSIIRRLETNVASAQAIVRTVEAAAQEAERLSQNTGSIVGDLLKGIEIVKVVRTDIQYMALNTNLRCSRIGEEGRAINVVTAELRAFAGQMDGTAEDILGGLQTLQTLATQMGARQQNADSQSGLSERLENVLSSIRVAASHMDACLKALGEQGRQAAEQMETAIGKLDFKAELGDILATCTSEVAAAVSGAEPDTADLQSAISEVGIGIARVYTMATERDLHAQVFGRVEEAMIEINGPSSDEELFDAALF